MTREERARRNFMQGMNCAQPSFLPFPTSAAWMKKPLSRFPPPSEAASGACARCAAPSRAALMAAGMLFYDAGNVTLEEKSALYAREQELAARFRAENGSIICRELLAGVAHDDAPQAEERTAEYYRKRPCPEICARAARMFAEYLREQGVLPPQEEV